MKSKQLHGEEESSYGEEDKCGPVRWTLLGLNVINHTLVLLVTGYVAYQAWDLSNVTNLHALLCTIGYPLLMSEAIISLADENAWSRYLTRRSNSHVHWVLQVIGAICSVSGVLVMYSRKSTHFRSTHALVGIISVLGICAVFLSGLPALFAARLRKMIRPVFSKFTHNTLGMTCFVLGMLAQCYGYQKGWLKRRAPEMVLAMTIATAAITLISLIGAVRQYRGQAVGVVKTFYR